MTLTTAYRVRCEFLNGAEVVREFLASDTNRFDAHAQAWNFYRYQKSHCNLVNMALERLHNGDWETVQAYTNGNALASKVGTLLADDRIA